MKRLSGPAGSAVIAAVGAKTCAITPASPGYTIDGGYAEYTVADQRYCFELTRFL